MIKRVMKIAILAISLFVLSSCNNSISENITSVKRKITNGFDDGRFIDVTLKNVDASYITKEDFENYTINKVFKRKSDTIRFENNKIIFNIDNSTKKDYQNKKIKIEYEYIINSGGKNSLCIYPKDIREVLVEIDGMRINPLTIGNLSYMVILYGFGENRIEINEVLEGESFINSGTYWKI